MAFQKHSKTWHKWEDCYFCHSPAEILSALKHGVGMHWPSHQVIIVVVMAASSGGILLSLSAVLCSEGCLSPMLAAEPGCSANSSSPEPEAFTADKSLWSGMHRWIWLSNSGLVFPKSRAALCAGSKGGDASMWHLDGVSWLCGCSGVAGRSQCALCRPVSLECSAARVGCLW